MNKPIIKLLPSTGPQHLERLRAPRCQHKTDGGLHGMDICNGKKIARCTRVARIDFNGIKVCKMHAGTMSLDYLARIQ